MLFSSLVMGRLVLKPWGRVTGSLMNGGTGGCGVGCAMAAAMDEGDSAYKER